MDSKIIQKRVDDLVKAMLAKGMREPRAQVDFKADEEPSTYIVWKSGFGKRTYGSDDTWKFFRGGLEKSMTDAAAFIAEQPNAEQAKLHDFMAALGSVIDIGREHNIKVEFLNPLVATMKTLSENVITDQRAA